MSTSPLALECRQARDAVNALIDFLDERRDIDRGVRALLRFDLDRALVAIPELSRSADRRPAIGLMAPLSSVADTLAAALAGAHEKRTVGQIGGSPVRLPVLTGLLPAGDPHGLSAIVRLTQDTDGQATGKAAESVGRMMPTSDVPRRPVDQGVRVDVLSLMDVILVLARAYLAHVKTEHIHAGIEPISAALEHAGVNEVAAAAQTGLAAHHVAAMRQYLEERFQSHPHLEALAAAGYWETFATLAQRLTPDGRRRLAGLLWGGLGDFDTVYGELAGALETVNHATEIILPAEAVRVPAGGAGWGEAHPFSVLAASTLLSDAEGAGEHIDVRTRFGQPVSIARNILTVLVRQVTVTVEGDATSFLARTDLLQLPTGTPQLVPRDTTRPRVRLLEQTADAPWLGRALAYAKALYLSELSIAGFELTGLVLHLDANETLNPHFATLLTNWIEVTQGNTPQLREANDTTLFVAVDAPGAVAPLAPLEAFLATPSNPAHWLERWGTESAFDNLFILGRAQRIIGPPSTGAGTIGPYARSHGSGTALTTLETARAGLHAGPWQRHVRDAAVAVDEALHAGDGGVVYLAQSIAAIDYQRAKRRQIAARLADISLLVADAFDRFLYASAPDAENDWRHRGALATQARLRTLASEQRLGALLDALLPRERGLTWLFERHLDERAGDGESEGLMRRLAALDQIDESTADRLASRYAARVMAHWMRHMRMLGLAPDMPQRFGFTGANINHLTEEIAAASMRAGLEQRIAATVARMLIDTPSSTGRSKAAQAARAGMLTSDCIAAFLSQLGFNTPWSSRHPRRRGTLGAPLFERPSATGPEDLSTIQAGRITLQFTADWCEGFGLMTEETINAARGMRFEESEFRELAELLSLLRANTRPSARERVL